jgi:hypothetical protein
VSRTEPRDLVVSYLGLRRIVGAIAFLLPFVLRIGIIAFSHNVPYSVSGYYYSPMRNILVASLCALGVFLIGYKGYDSLDSSITNVAGGAAIGVAFFPTSDPSFRPVWVGHVHPFFAAVAMVSLALMALQFTQTRPRNKPTGTGSTEPRWMQDIKRMGLALLYKYQDPQYRTDRKKLRDRIYSSCAWLILVGVVLGLIQNFWPKSIKDVTQWLFWFEALAIIAFGVSWLVKGETILKDKPGSRKVPESYDADQASVQ